MLKFWVIKMINNYALTFICVFLITVLSCFYACYFGRGYESGVFLTANVPEMYSIFHILSNPLSPK